MAENVDSLFFDWYVNKQKLKEIYHPRTDSSYEFSSEMRDYSIVARELFQKDDFAISDYIFQMQFILNLYVLKNLNEKIGSKEITDVISLLESAEHNFLKVVNCTKLIFDSLCRFEIAFNEMCFQQRNRFESESFESELNSISLKFLRSVPDVGYNFFLRMDLGKAKKNFARIRDSFVISDWIAKIKKLIQKKANQIVDYAIPFLSYSLWNNFRANENNGYDINAKRLFVSYSQAMQILDTMVNNYVGYNKKGCCAICFTDDEKYYSLNGVDDYKGNLSKIKGWIQRKDFQDIIDALSPGDDFKYAYLNDSVKCYGVNWKKDQKQRAYLTRSKPWPKSLANIYNNPNLVQRDISCCERKIMAACPNASNYEFYIRYDPCDWCCPDLLSKGGNTITFVTSEGWAEPLIKLKIKQIKSQGSLPWYEFEKV